MVEACTSVCAAAPKPDVVIFLVDLGCDADAVWTSPLIDSVIFMSDMLWKAQTSHLG